MRINCIAGWLTLALIAVEPATAQTGSRTLPAAIVMTAPAVTVDDATYSFEVVLTDYKIVRGVPELRVGVTVTRNMTAGVVRFRDINQVVTHDRSSVTISVDGLTFAVEANYRDPFDRNLEPRLIPTTFGEMFRGGKVGLTVKVVS